MQWHRQRNISQLISKSRFIYWLPEFTSHLMPIAKQPKGVPKSDGDTPIIYVWPEDEVFHKLSSWTFFFRLRSRPTDEMKNYKPMGLVMSLEAKKVPTFQKEPQSLISES